MHHALCLFKKMWYEFMHFSFLSSCLLLGGLSPLDKHFVIQTLTNLVDIIENHYILTFDLSNYV